MVYRMAGTSGALRAVGPMRIATVNVITDLDDEGLPLKAGGVRPTACRGATASLRRCVHRLGTPEHWGVVRSFNPGVPATISFTLSIGIVTEPFPQSVKLALV